MTKTERLYMNKSRAASLIAIARAYTSGKMSYEEFDKRRSWAGVTQSAITAMATAHGAADLTNAHDLPCGLTCFAISYGRIGMNAGAFIDDAGRIYVVTGRTSALFALV